MKPVCSSLTQYLDGMLYPLLVVFARAFMLDSLPCEDVTNGIVSPTPQSCKMLAGFVHGEGAADELDIVTVKESVRYMRATIWDRGKLCVAGDINAVQRDFTILGVSECGSIDSQSQGGNGGG